jgi:hypothetical protein
VVSFLAETFNGSVQYLLFAHFPGQSFPGHKNLLTDRSVSSS